MEVPRILIIRGGAIGDFVLTLPVMSALCERFPKADLEVLGYPRIASLALSGGLVKAVHPIESPELAMFFSQNLAADLKWRKFFSGFSIIMVLIKSTPKFRCMDSSRKMYWNCSEVPTILLRRPIDRIWVKPT